MLTELLTIPHQRFVKVHVRYVIQYAKKKIHGSVYYRSGEIHRHLSEADMAVYS